MYHTYHIGDKVRLVGLNEGHITEGKILDIVPQGPTILVEIDKSLFPQAIGRHFYTYPECIELVK